MTPKKICYFFLFVGLAMFCFSLILSYYKDQNAKDKLDVEAMENLSGQQYEKFKEHYYTEVDKLKTNKVLFMDLGAGLSIALITILIFLFQQNIDKFLDFKTITSLDKQKIFVLANIAWLLLIPGTYWYYMFRGSRGDYPPFADSIAIPLAYQIPPILIGLIPLNIFILLSFIKSYQPTKLFIRPLNYNAKEIFKEIFWGGWLLLNIVCLVLFVLDGDHISIVVNLVFTYILLTLRAGQINRQIS